MKRIKIIGLAAIMALALAAVGASTASASFFSYTKYEAVAYPSTEQATQLVFSGGRVVNCEKENEFPAQYAAASESLTTEVEYPSCNNPLVGPATLKMNSCRWIHRPGAETSPGVFAGTLEVGPAGCTPMVLTWPGCKFSIAAQSAAAGSSYINGTTAGKPTVTIKDQNVSLKTTRTEGTLSGCGPESQTFSLGAKTHLGATSLPGVAIGVRVTPRPAVGLFMSGKESAEKALQPKLEAESYPVTIAGEQDSAAKHVITVTGGRKFECAKISSAGEITGSTTELSLSSTYSTCTSTLAGVPVNAAIEMNSCHYTLGVLNVGPPYSSSLGVACTKEGDSISLKAWEEGKKVGEGEPFCAYTIAPQSGLSSVGLTNTGEFTERGVSAVFNVAGLAYERTVGTTGPCGSKTNTATYKGTTKLTAAS